MKRIHIALAVGELESSIIEYTKRLGAKPCCVVANAYALWRTDQVNLSITVNAEEAGTLRHLGFEDSDVKTMNIETDINGFIWERFTEDQQNQEILNYWPNAGFLP
jgi:hypothetical protein